VIIYDTVCRRMPPYLMASGVSETVASVEGDKLNIWHSKSEQEDLAVRQAGAQTVDEAKQSIDRYARRD
jgi:hypothetical protein